MRDERDDEDGPGPWLQPEARVYQEKTGSLCGTLTGLQLEILLPLLPECRDHRPAPLYGLNRFDFDALKMVPDELCLLICTAVVIKGDKDGHISTVTHWEVPEEGVTRQHFQGTRMRDAFHSCLPIFLAFKNSLNYTQ